MATSTFGKQFSVKPNRVTTFVKEMTRPATPTLPKDFRSNLANLSQETDFKKSLLKALNK